MNALMEVTHERFVKDSATGYLIDTQVHHKTLAAQERTERIRKVKERRRRKRAS